jgi:hypothetical protein
MLPYFAQLSSALENQESQAGQGDESTCASHRNGRGSAGQQVAAHPSCDDTHGLPPTAAGLLGYQLQLAEKVAAAKRRGAGEQLIVPRPGGREPGPGGMWPDQLVHFAP